MGHFEDLPPIFFSTSRRVIVSKWGSLGDSPSPWIKGFAQGGPYLPWMRVIGELLVCEEVAPPPSPGLGVQVPTQVHFSSFGPKIKHPGGGGLCVHIHAYMHMHMHMRVFIWILVCRCI